MPRLKAGSWVTAALMAAAWATPALGQRPAGPSSAGTALAALADLHDGWNTLAPGGETICATGEAYHFFVNPQSVDRVLIFFSGGGACWTGKNCDPKGEPTYEYRVPDDPPSAGTFDRSNPQNPLARYSMVFIGYCTGDVHLGDRDTAYTVPDSSGTHMVAIHHRGQRNAMAVLDWVFDNFPAPTTILVSGSSAGAVATPFYASFIARHYAKARVVALGDAAGAYTNEGIDGTDQGRWGIPEVLRRFPGWQDYEKGGVPELYLTAAGASPGLHLYQVDPARDDAQRFFLQLAGTKDPDVAALIRRDHAEISAAVPAFRYFMIGGEIHTVMGEPMFYTYETHGYRFRDWVARIANGDTVPNIDCGDCGRPGFAYSRRDLTIVDDAIRRLSSTGAWNPREDTVAANPCPAHARQVSLACALVEAARSHGVAAPGATPALLDAAYDAAERLHLALRDRPLAAFNNRPGASLENMLALLRAVRNRIVAHLVAS